MLASLAVVAIFSAACTSDDRADPASGQLFETPEPVAANSQPAPDQGVTDDSVEEPVIEDDFEEDLAESVPGSSTQAGDLLPARRDPGGRSLDVTPVRVLLPFEDPFGGFGRRATDPNWLVDIVELTPEHFTAYSGVIVHFTFAGPEAVAELPPPGDQYDLWMVDLFSPTQLGDAGVVQDLGPRIATEELEYETDEVVPSLRESVSIDDAIYTAPVHVESSLLMYNQSILTDAGIEVPDEPTWEEVADIARQVHSNEVAGICMRGREGWQELGTSLTSVVNTFGGTWWEANSDGTARQPQINQPDSGFWAATEFYVKLLIDAGPDGAEQMGFEECRDLFEQGQVAMWYGSTRAGPLLESADSPIAGNVGYVSAPTNLTANGAWLQGWGLAVPSAETPHVNTLEYLSWLTSDDFVQIASVYGIDGWADVPGTRVSTYEIPEYREATEGYGDPARDAIFGADPTNPGTTSRPGFPAVSHVGIPEYPDIANRCTAQISAAIARHISVYHALDQCQQIAGEASSG